MSEFNFLVLYVDDVSKSTAFYSGLLGKPVQASSPGFAVVPLSPHLTLGLWARDEVEPPAKITGGGEEIGLEVADAEAVRSTHADWQKRGVTIAQPPTTMGFGDTFVGLDPDGHRLRVFAPRMQ